MNTASIPVGISDFAKVRAQGSYYIDKTGLIKQLLDARGTEIMLFTRPRRFGKTMAVSMLAEFFDIQKDSRSLFEGLEISHEKKLCAEWQNQFPVLYLTLKDVGGLAFDTAYGQLAYELAGLCRDHAYLGYPGAAAVPAAQSRGSRQHRGPQCAALFDEADACALWTEGNSAVR